MPDNPHTTLKKLRAELEVAVYPGASAHEQHKYAIQFLCAEIDALKAKLPKDRTPTNEDFAR